MRSAATDPLQNWAALGIVAAAALWLGFRVFRFAIAPRLAQALLKHGKVKWAMRIRSLSVPGHPGKPPRKLPRKSGSGDCCS